MPSFTDDQIKEMIDLKGQGRSNQYLAVLHNISLCQVGKIINGYMKCTRTTVYQDMLSEKGLVLKSFETGNVAIARKPDKQDQLSFIKSKVR